MRGSRWPAIVRALDLLTASVLQVSVAVRKSEIRLENGSGRVLKTHEKSVANPPFWKRWIFGFVKAAHATKKRKAVTHSLI